MTFRDNGKLALSTILNIEKNINIIEKYIFDASTNSENEDENENLYNEYIYQTIGDIISGNKLKPTLANIKSKKLGWKHPSFDDFAFRLQEQDDFILNPFEVEEGVLECRCGSKRVYSYQRQTRGSDEPMSTFAECVACKNKWMYSG